MYFFGVTTGSSSIMRIFPEWAKMLGIPDAKLVGLDFAINDDPAKFYAAVEHIKHDPNSLGALVTTHKLDVAQAAKDLFDDHDEFAAVLSEVSCIYKDGKRLVAAAKDAVTSGLTLDQFVPENHWVESEAEVLMLGAGGAAVACSWYLMHPDRGPHQPTRIHVTDIDANRIDHMRSIHAKLNSTVPVEYHLTPTGDELLKQLPPGSLVINATGMGKDRPGSPLSNDAAWPAQALAWEFNYRGELSFLEQARTNATASDGRGISYRYSDPGSIVRPAVRSRRRAALSQKQKDCSSTPALLKHPHERL